MEVIWTREAEISFNQTLDYLLEKWTTKQANNFIELVYKTISQIVQNPELFPVSRFNAFSRAAVLTKHNTMYYRLLNEIIEIEYFWNNYQDPNKLKKLLEE